MLQLGYHLRAVSTLDSLTRAAHPEPAHKCHEKLYGNRPDQNGNPLRLQVENKACCTWLQRQWQEEAGNNHRNIVYHDDEHAVWSEERDAKEFAEDKEFILLDAWLVIWSCCKNNCRERQFKADCEKNASSLRMLRPVEKDGDYAQNTAYDISVNNVVVGHDKASGDKQNKRDDEPEDDYGSQA